MKKLLPIFLSFLLASCAAHQKLDPETLPKDASLKPSPESSREKDAEDMKNLRAEIDDMIAKQPCTNPAEWRISPIGSKSCGGPSGYLAYPIKIENEILPKIKEYTAEQSAFNKKYHLVSDCMMVAPPTEIVCSGDKAILKNAGSAQDR